MTFWNPAALWALAALPLVLLPYLLRERPRRRTVSALFLYEGIERSSRLRLFGRPRLETLILLQLPLLALLALGMARPALEAEVPRRAIVVDDGATMQTTDASGRSRLERAVEAARGRIAAAPAAAWDVFVLHPAPHAVVRGVDGDEAAAALDRVRALDVARGDEAGTLSFLRGLADAGYAGVTIATDRLASRRSPPFEVLSVGEPVDNAAIVAASAETTGERARLRVSVASFAAAEGTREIEARDAATGERLGMEAIRLAPGGLAHAELDVPAAAAIAVALLPGDRFAADDEAFVVLRASRRRVLLVSPLGIEASGLPTVARSLGLEIDAVAPADYRPGREEGHDLAIFHRSAPEEPPAVPALYLLPPPAPGLPALAGEAVTSPRLVAAEPTHPALRYLNAGSLRPRRALPLRAGREWNPLLVSAAGPVLAVRSGEQTAAVAGFDLLPYLGDRNRAASILTLDLIAWLADARSPAAAPTGEPLAVPRRATAVELPGGERLAPPPARVETARRGVYWIDLGERREPHARSFASAEESDLRSRPPFPLPAPGEATPPRLVTRSRPLWPALIAVAMVLLLLEASRHVRRRDGSALAWTLRAASVALLAAALVDPDRELPGKPAPETILLDVSASVLPDAQGAARARARTLAPDAPVRPFAAGVLDAAGEPAETGATDVEAALLAVAAAADGPLAVRLASDGWETRGDARRAIPALRERGIRVDALPITQQPPGNVAAVRLALPARGEAGEAVEASLVVANENATPSPVEVVLRRGDATVARKKTTLAPGESAIVFPVLLAADGLVDFTAEVQVADASRNDVAADDVAKAWIAVRGRPSVLLAGRGERENRLLARALETRGFRVRAVVASGGRALPSPEDFGAVVLNDVAEGDLPRGFAGRVRDAVARGGSLLMTGGTRSFGLGGWKGTSVEEALPVRMKERERDEPRLSVALVIDKSGSMREEHRMLYAREAARALAEGLRDEDRLAVIGFDRESFLLIPLSPARAIRADFDFRIDRLRPSGGTRLYPALAAARRELLGEETQRRHVIVLSDGLSEDAETAAGRRSYYDLALAMAEQGVTVTTIALGDSADADFLERLAGFGRGAFHLTLDPATLPDLVLGEFRGPTPEKTLREERIRPVPDRASPLVGEVARASGSWPALLGMVETVTKPGARVDVATTSRDPSPLLASWTFGSGRAAAFASDVYGRWSDPWVRWDEWSRLWAEIVGWLLPALPESGAELSAGWESGAIVVDAAFDEDLEGEPPLARATGPEGIPEEARFTRMAPGYFRARLPAETAGDYRIEVLRGGAPLTRPPLGFTVAAERSQERPREAANLDLLADLAAATGGRVDPEPGAGQPLLGPPEKEPLAPWILAAAFALFLVELLVRRVRSGRGTLLSAALDRVAATSQPRGTSPAR